MQCLLDGGTGDSCVGECSTDTLSLNDNSAIAFTAIPGGATKISPSIVSTYIANSNENACPVKDWSIVDLNKQAYSGNLVTINADNKIAF